MAPEVFSSKGYTDKVDVFSAGIILYTMLNGSPPFKGKDIKIIVKKTCQDKIKFSKHFQSNVSFEIKQLILRMTEKNPEKRITLQDLFNLDWVSDLSLIHI
eukprot:TRINITY_DN7207_c0_g1_i2.p2 TRINITY_DN7207_c0_g1~~TRINITY_DN7207_c0_g1_i2.p2  ORF type:complete len:101 (+),score=5.71 TRINITY_DN7207_c0_g1_i2:205-507(+)